MSINVGTGVASLRADRSLNKASDLIKKNFDRLASGKRINNAADDPAGLAVALDLLSNADVRSVAARNMGDAVSMATIADGALEQTSDITMRMSELAMQSSNGTLSDTQRKALNDEFQALRGELDRISSTTEFNGQSLLGGDANVDLQVGTDSSAHSRLQMKLPGVSSQSLGLTGDISTRDGALAMLDSSRKASGDVASSRGEIGAVVNRIGVALENSRTNEVGERSAASQIMDADIAQESASLSANNIRQQAAAAVKAQANLQPEIALRLLS